MKLRMEPDRSLDTTPSSLRVIMLASTGEPFDKAVIDRVVAISGRSPSPLVGEGRGGGYARPFIHVVSIARVWGTSLGLQHPALYPTRREWNAQKDLVEKAVQALELRGFDVKGRVIGSRYVGKTIAKAAAEMGCDAIVIGSRPVAGWRRFIGQDEPQQVVRRSAIPVHLVELPAHH